MVSLSLPRRLLTSVTSLTGLVGHRSTLGVEGGVATPLTTPLVGRATTLYHLGIKREGSVMINKQENC